MRMVSGSSSCGRKWAIHRHLVFARKAYKAVQGLARPLQVAAQTASLARPGRYRYRGSEEWLNEKCSSERKL